MTGWRLQGLWEYGFWQPRCDEVGYVRDYWINFSWGIVLRWRLDGEAYQQSLTRQDGQNGVLHHFLHLYHSST